LWTSPNEEKEGIHVHAYDADMKPVVDGTYASVEIDGIELNSLQVRTYMAQLAMPHIAERITSAKCVTCKAIQFDGGVDSYTPSSFCHNCGNKRASNSGFQKVVSNPIVEQISRLEKSAVNPVRRDRLNLRAESI
jgi:hypothetical protein